MNTPIDKYPDIRPHDQIYMIFSNVPAGSSAILTMTHDQMYDNFGGISDLQEFVARGSSRYGKQGSVREMPDVILVHIGDGEVKTHVFSGQKEVPRIS